IPILRLRAGRMEDQAKLYREPGFAIRVLQCLHRTFRACDPIRHSDLWRILSARIGFRVPGYEQPCATREPRLVAKEATRPHCDPSGWRDLLRRRTTGRCLQPDK